MGATIRTFKFDKLEVGEWKIKMMAKQSKDAYLVVSDYKGWRAICSSNAYKS